MEVRESIARAIATAGGAVLFAGGTVAISLVALVVAGIPLVTTLGYTAAIAVVFAILAALTLLPAMFGLLGHHISSLQLPFGKRRAAGQSPLLDEGGDRGHESPLAGDGRGTRRSARLSIPTLSLRLGQPDTGEDPTDTTARQAYDLITKGFGVGTNGPFLIAVELTTPAKPDAKEQQQVAQKQQQQQQSEQQQIAQLEAQGVPPSQAQQQVQSSPQVQQQNQQLSQEKKQADSPASDPRLTTLQNDLAKTKGVKSVSPPLANTKGTAAVYTLIPTTSPSDLDTENLVTRLRDETIPEATKGQGMEAFVGGRPPPMSTWPTRSAASSSWSSWS